MYITILVKQVYWYISQVSGERLQDHWSSGLTFYHFSVTQVHLYVVKNNLTDTEASIENTDKEFLSSVDAFAIVSADDEGTPANDIKGKYIFPLLGGV